MDRNLDTIKYILTLSTFYLVYLIFQSAITSNYNNEMTSRFVIDDVFLKLLSTKFLKKKVLFYQ